LIVLLSLRREENEHTVFADVLIVGPVEGSQCGCPNRAESDDTHATGMRLIIAVGP